MTSSRSAVGTCRDPIQLQDDVVIRIRQHPFLTRMNIKDKLSSEQQLPLPHVHSITGSYRGGNIR
jgi:hypothetical protein